VSPLRRVYHSMNAMADAVVRPPYVRNGHFYSPVNNPTDVERALAWDREDLPGVDLREQQQRELFAELVPLFDGVPKGRYHAPNGMYDAADASVYQAFVRRLAPKRVIEVGAGHSTAKLLDTADAFVPELQVTCVEPYPARLLSVMRPKDKPRVTLIAKPVQDVPVDTFTALEPGDVLFIDSTHVAKAGSDVLWLFLRVLPRLAPGVVVHVHDVFWPFEYPAAWLREGRSWNEDYLLHAFLCQNPSWRVDLFSSWLWKIHPDLVPEHLRDQQPGSIWLTRV
jgi:predicted O-methyltransferase YrrM